MLTAAFDSCIYVISCAWSYTIASGCRKISHLALMDRPVDPFVQHRL